ncbi:hypothetical protein BA059_27470 [Mycolicibacterium sp. (ex Dasyatis americana)]|nr:hypothetical protein BA059_27470 [Mycolicibacterium sp. (ex Dasyatis americana)]
MASGLLLGGSLLPIYLGSRRINDWVRHIEAADCLPPWPDVPDLAGIGWTAVWLAIPAVLCLIIGVVLFVTGQRTTWVKLAVTVGGLCVLLVALVVMAMGYTDATQEIDRYTVSGSDGGPLCPAPG